MGAESRGPAVGFGILVLAAGMVAVLAAGDGPADRPEDGTLPGAQPDEVDLTACEDMPHLRAAAHVITYAWTTRTVTYDWEDGQSATLRDTDPGCASQPGLEADLRGSRQGHLATQKADCQSLRHLVEAVIEERQAQGKPIRGVGRVVVSDAAAEKAYGKNPHMARYIESGRIHEMRAPSIDLGGSLRALAGCPD